MTTPAYFRRMRLGRYQQRPRPMPPGGRELLLVGLLGMLYVLARLMR